MKKDQYVRMGKKSLANSKRVRRKKSAGTKSKQRNAESDLRKKTKQNDRFSEKANNAKKRNSKTLKGTKKKRIESKKIKRQPIIKNIVAELALTLVLSSVIILVISNLLFAFTKVSGYAMTPNLQDGQRTIVYRHGEIRRFDRIYFKVPGRSDGLETIRRVIGLPGERVEYKEDVLYVNGEEQAERFIGEYLSDARENDYVLTENFSIVDILGKGQDTIPEGYYLVLGDNRTFSIDSREYGLVPEQNIIGTVSVVF